MLSGFTEHYASTPQGIRKTGLSSFYQKADPLSKLDWKVDKLGISREQRPNKS
jgi:hypothetical protein